MPDSVLRIDVAAWVARAKSDAAKYQQRQMVEVTLSAIAMSAPFSARMFLKGGTLMGLAYDSPRMTADIDLTSSMKPRRDLGDIFKDQINSVLPRAAAELGYVDLVFHAHSVKYLPRKRTFETARAPAIKLKVSSAIRNTAQERALLQGTPSTVISVDISFNERLGELQILEMTNGRELYAYGLVDLIAEKYRALLQQETRNRNRRQDVFDLDRLIRQHSLDAEVRARIH